MSFIAPFPMPKKEDQFTLYTIEGCPSCRGALELLRNLKINGKPVLFKAYNADMLMELLERHEQGKDGRSLLFKKMDKLTKGYRYFPMIFIRGKFIGGFDELKRLNRR
jgi:glutaredoxin